MTTLFVSRHPGAREWARRHKLNIDYFVEHLDLKTLRQEDTVIGTLPVHLATQVQHRVRHYIHLALDLPADLRGKELSVEQLADCNARLCAFHISEQPLPSDISTISTSGPIT